MLEVLTSNAQQLVKSGNDDLRQDAVMQQVFGLIIDLLGSSAESQQRQLSLRTYRCAS
jgi:ataxia telangiectasia mutated family protein